MKSESIVNITKAIIEVMKSVKGIDKTMTIGTGSNAYKGVSDQIVKQIIGDAMAANGLAIIPTKVDNKATLSQWDEVDQYSKSTPKDTKRKQSVFVEVETSYLLLHESGEYLTIAGFGHGVDSQDKAAGKATTYALKYALLYTFLIPTGKIDDSDNTHSDNIAMPTTTKPAIDYTEYDNAIVELLSCTTVDGVKSCWAKFRQFQTDERFITIKNEKKNECN
jgi:hypothetical protein